jgi:hypothetical protein
VPEATEIERGLQELEAQLKRLEAEYNMYFAGRLPKPPWETRSRVEAMVRRYDRDYLNNYGDRFRFATLQSRYAKLIVLWDRGLRAREEGRPGPFTSRRPHPGPQADTHSTSEAGVLHVAAFRDPLQQGDRLRQLYQSVVEARQQVGAEAIPFDRFAELVRAQVERLKTGDGAEVAFRVAVKDGKVSFTARVLKGEGGEGAP